jgi:hypothetical protein
VLTISYNPGKPVMAIIFAYSIQYIFKGMQDKLKLANHVP